MTKNIISFSLYGTKNMYWKGALANIELAKTIYPNYVCRFYIDQDAPSELKNSIVGDNVEKVFMKNRGGIDGMFWRFLPATEKNVDIFLCRDTDSRVSLREKAAVDEWLLSDKDFHIMRDHAKGHIQKIMGGMWGCRNKIGIKIKFGELLNSWYKRDKFGDDQIFLAEKIYPLVQSSCFEHSEYGIKFSNPIHKFSYINTNNTFVGEKII